MTVVRRFTPEVRLKTLLAEPGGLKVGQALQRAEEGIESIRGDCLTAIDRKIEEISQSALTDANDARIYTLANEVFAEAGVFKLDEISAVAHSLCELLSVGDSDKLPREAIRVHCDAMRALRSPAIAANKQMRDLVLGELRGLSQRFASGA